MCSLGERTTTVQLPGQHLCWIRDTIDLEHGCLVQQEAHWTGIIKDSTAIFTFSWYTLFSQTRKWRPSHSGITVSPGMVEMPSLHMPVQRLRLAILPLDLLCSGPVTHSSEILTTGKSHEKIREYKRSWIQYANRMPRNRLPRVMKYYSPAGRRNHGRPLKRPLDTWDRNVSASGPTPWKIYDDDVASLNES